MQSGDAGLGGGVPLVPVVQVVPQQVRLAPRLLQGGVEAALPGGGAGGLQLSGAQLRNGRE